MVVLAAGRAVAAQLASLRAEMAYVALALKLPVAMLNVLPVMLNAWAEPPFTV